MKQRKNISKIALLAGLLMLNTTANSFYQCVPKKEWVEKIMKEKEDKNWVLVGEVSLFVKNKELNIKNIYLYSGQYKIIAYDFGKDKKESNIVTIQKKICLSKMSFPPSSNQVSQGDTEETHIVYIRNEKGIDILTIDPPATIKIYRKNNFTF